MLVAAGVWFFLSPKKIPEMALKKFPSTFAEEKVLVGGPCSAEKCLTVYLAPWCGACKSLTPMIVDLNSQMETDGIPFTIVVGADTPAKILDYAGTYPLPVVMDLESKYKKAASINNYPTFIVTNKKGQVIKRYKGGYHEAVNMRKALDL